jgi:hypothetical protein
MENMPPYQSGQPPEDQAGQSGQMHEHQPERPHNYRLDQPSAYRAEQTGQSPAQAGGDQAGQRRLRIRRRPCGVVLMSLFLLAQGLFMLITGVFGILGTVVLVFDFSRGSTLLLHGLVAFALGILSIIFAFGIFMLTRWAFWAAVCIAFFNFLMSLTILVQTNFVSFGHIFSGIFSLVVLFYFLFDPDARAAFSKDAPSLVEF